MKTQAVCNAPHLGRPEILFINAVLFLVSSQTEFNMEGQDKLGKLPKCESRL